MAIITLREKTLFRETRTINAFVRIINIFFLCVCVLILILFPYKEVI